MKIISDNTSRQRLFLLCIIILVALIISGYFLIIRSKNVNTEINRALETSWERVELKSIFPYKKNIKIDYEVIRNILRNLTTKPNIVTKGIYIEINIFLKNQKEPFKFFISRSGWGIDVYDCDCFSYKDDKLGQDSYEHIFNKIEDYL